jgi:5'-phosphate synthase pdxT subunit
LRLHGLDDRLRSLSIRGVPLLGVCAGMILLRARDGRHCEDRLTLELIDMAVDNNAVSGEHPVLLAGKRLGPVRLVNAPVVAGEPGSGVAVLARLETDRQEIVGVRQGSVMAFAFHEEVHDLFLRHCLDTWAD